MQSTSAETTETKVAQQPQVQAAVILLFYFVIINDFLKTSDFKVEFN